MAFATAVWDQIRNITTEELCSALQRDGWAPDCKTGSIVIYTMGDGEKRRRVSIHRRAKKSYGNKSLLGALLKDIGWSEDDLRRLKVIKESADQPDRAH